eukprot:TRINITY_DN5537_c0_g2_i1.p1 TRINITY_DN5537_c0_g2~~TRINITY_DN5537_c0_g2_i1.p1  ORF type:complete len:212 (-),score=41.61 TRINITY_DN5537_c0_g2_i1:51-686(-)
MCIRDRYMGKMEDVFVKVAFEGEEARVVQSGANLDEFRLNIVLELGSRVGRTFSLHYFDDAGDKLTIDNDRELSKLREDLTIHNKSRKIIIIPHPEIQEEVSATATRFSKVERTIEEPFIQHGIKNYHFTKTLKFLQRGFELSKPCIITSAKKFENGMYAYHDKINSIVPKLFEWQDLVNIGETIKTRFRAHYEKRQNPIDYKEMSSVSSH